MNVRPENTIVPPEGIASTQKDLIGVYVRRDIAAQIAMVCILESQQHAFSPFCVYGYIYKLYKKFFFYAKMEVVCYGRCNCEHAAK